MTPPKRGLDSKKTYSSSAPRLFCCCSANAADSPEIPPPMMAILFMRNSSRFPRGPQSRVHDLGEREDQEWRGVQRLCPRHAQVFFFGKPLEDDVNVVEDLDVITEKTNRLDENSGIPAALEIKNRCFDGRAQPCASGHSLALKSEPPVQSFEPSRGCDQFGSLTSLALIRIAFQDSALRNAVCGEDDGH